MQNGQQDKLISPEALGELVDVPVATIYKWRTTGKGPRGLRVGKHLRYRMSDVDAWLDACADKSA